MTSGGLRPRQQVADRTRLAAVATVGLVAAAATAHAGHSYTELYSPLYVVGVALVVVLSFVLIAVAMRRSASASWTGYERAWVGGDASLGLRRAGIALRGAFVVGLALVVSAGLAGSRISTWNIAPALVWVVAWLLLPAVQVFVVDVWTAVNPWRTVFEWTAGERRPRLSYPAWLGAWPAVILFLGLLWLKIATPVASDPRLLGGLALGYSLVTWTGMALFGASLWLARVECFTVFYGLIAAAAPLEVREAAGRRRLVLRPPAVGLLARPRPGLDTVSFVLVALAGSMFAGLLETRSWESLRVARGWSARGSLVENTGVFLAFVALTVGVYGLSCVLVRLVAGPTLSPRAIGGAFAFSLLPLAVGFHVTHGLDHTLESVQMLVRLASDPFGFGWDVFGSRRLAIARPEAWLVWDIQLLVIVAVHVAGLWVAHAQALALYPDRGAAVRSQVPMVAVMVLFTISGLWILSRIPILL